MPNSYFDAIVQSCGLSEVFAADTIARACDRVGIKPEQLSPADLSRLLPQIERALRIFLPKDEVPMRIAALQMLSVSPATAR